MAQSSFQGFLSPRPDKKAQLSNMKSQQGGTITWTDTATTKDITISAVDVTKILAYVSVQHNGGLATNEALAVTVINSTTIRLTRNTGTSLGVTIISWEVYEFNNVKSLQSGNITISIGENTVTVSSINTNKCILFETRTSTVSDTNAASFVGGSRIVSSTSIAFTANANNTVYWQLLEFI